MLLDSMTMTEGNFFIHSEFSLHAAVIPNTNDYSLFIHENTALINCNSLKLGIVHFSTLLGTVQ